MAAKECVVSKLRQCGAFELTQAQVLETFESAPPEVLEATRYLGVLNRVLSYICVDHVEGTQSHSSHGRRQVMQTP